ncbi:nucleotide disphospho-sugar-binding domain-containing protein [Dactylosporangium sp. CA-092794]|uniref:nucleotide disphospho-sugar-binding domain-containing protein n=1 Tax=Dactylosporangium sp. CA-092794 TaxID=3239929 RepID=UPI003D8D407F
MVSPQPTHLTPMVPLAWALRAAGHEVLVAGQPDIGDAARGAGFPVALLGAAYDDVGRRRRAASTPAPQGQALWDSFAERWRDRMRQVVPHYLGIAGRWRPDLILADPLEFAAGIVGAGLAIPVVHHRWGVDALSDTRWRHARTALEPVCAEFGLGAGPRPPDLVVDPCPPRLQQPGISAGAPVRFVPYNGPGEYPAWLRREGRPPRRVCVCLGTRTVALDGAAVLANVVRAVAGVRGVDEVVVATGPDRRRELTGLPANVRVAESVPLNLMMHRVAAVVHHGGAGTALTATAFGRPQLVLPQAPYLVEHGERISAVGAGVLLREAEQTAQAIESAVAALLSEPEWRGNAEDLAAEMAASPPPAALVPSLTALARS